MKDLYKGKKVLVTGAGGFIGSHLVEALARSGAEVTALIHYNALNSWGNLEALPAEILSNINVEAGDITDASFVRRLTDGNEVVFHLAALIAIPYSYVAPVSYVRTNVEGTVNMLEAARECGVRRFIHTSTSETYGTALYTPIDEGHPMQGQSPYSASKISADKMAESYYRSFGLPVVTVRPFNTYGPRQSARAVIPTIAMQLAAGESTLKLGALDPVRDMNYVEDTVRGFMLAALAGEDCLGEVVNLGTGRGVTIGEVANKLMEISGRQVSIEEDRLRIRPDKSEVFTLIASNEKAKRLLNWEPSISLEEGLKRMYDYVCSNIDRYRVKEYNI